MTIDDYLPLFGFSSSDDEALATRVTCLKDTRRWVFLSDLLNDSGMLDEYRKYKDYEITEDDIYSITEAEMRCFSNLLKSKGVTKDNIELILRGNFNYYRQIGEGDPIYWLETILRFMFCYPEDFNPDIIGTVEKILIEWLEVSKKAKTMNVLEPQPVFETLSNLITHCKSNKIVESLKIQYKNIKGKRLKLLLIALQDLNLIDKERVASRFHSCCKAEFPWDIASYPAMNDYKYNDLIDRTEIEEMKQYINKIIS